MMTYRRPHPIKIIENTSRFWALLLLPVLRGLLFSGETFSQWLRGAWFDLLILLGIFGLGFVSWYFNTFAIEDDGLYIRRGILVKRCAFIPFIRLATATIEYPFYLLPFRAVHLNADTDAGSSRVADFSLTMHRQDAEELVRRGNLPFRMNDRLRRVYHPRGLYVAILSVITSNTLTGVLYISAFISQSGNLLGKEFEDLVVESLTNLAKILAFGIPPVAAILAYIVLGGWLISFLLNLIRNKDFEVTRCGGTLEIKAGLFTRRHYSIAAKRVNLVEVQQSLLTKLFGFYTVFIHATGYGKRKNERAVLIPAADRLEARRNLGVLLPEIPLGNKQLRPPLRTLNRFLFLPLCYIFGVATVFGLAYWLFPNFRDILLFIGIMAELPSVWFLFVKITSFFHTGIGLQNGVYTFRSTYAFAFYSTSIPIRRISKIIIRQNIWQKLSDSCDVVVYAYAEGKTRRVVNNMPMVEVHDLLKLQMDPNERARLLTKQQKRTKATKNSQESV